MPNIIIKNYEHINRSFANWDTPKGKYIRTKDDYDRAMKEEGMVSYEEAQRRSENKNLKEYILSKKARSIIETAKNSKDRRGNVKLSDKMIEAMQEIGAINKKIPEYMKLPGGSMGNGGFYTI